MTAPNPMPTVIAVDTREPDPHPWTAYLPAGLTVKRTTLETGDLAPLGWEDLVCVERKTCSDLLACIGRERERFERELRRARHLGKFCIVVEASMADLLREARGIHGNAILGSLAAWTRRGAPVVLAGTVQSAAAFAWRFMLGQFNLNIRKE
jgi:ERCC4-type nuclease